MIVIPAVDVKGGKCVRLEQGLMDKETIFSDYPEKMALCWEENGAERLHIVDLDGAVHGKAVNRAVIKKIVDTVSIPVQVGGGIRSLDTINEYVGLGVSRIIMGTGAYKDPEVVESACREFPGRIIVGIDARDSYVAVEGWTQSTEIVCGDLAKRFEAMGIDSVIYTDIKRDGMKNGPNIESIRRFAEGLNVPVIAAGGISSIEDVEAVSALEEEGVQGVIIGRALYDGSLTLGEALIAAKKNTR